MLRKKYLQKLIQLLKSSSIGVFFINFNNWLYLENSKLNKATNEQLILIKKLEKDHYLEIVDKSTLTKEKAKNLIEIGLQEKYRDEMDKYYDCEFE